MLWTIGLLACGDPGLGSIPEGEPVFRNFDEGVECTLARNLAPTNVDEVQRAVRWASSRSLRVRAVSSERSCSENDIVCPGDEGVLLNLSGLNQVLEVDTDAQTIRVEPGVTVGEIGDALHEAGLSMRVNMPNRDFTAAGVIATGAHHTSLRFPSGMHDAVREIVLVDGRGDVVTLRDDEARGAAAHLGVLGIVVELTFQAEPELKTLHRVTSGDDMDFENRIVEMARAHDYASFSWFPSQGRWVLRQHDLVDASMAGEARNTSWNSTPGEQRLQAMLADSTNRDPEGESTMCAIEALRADDDSLSHVEADGSDSVDETVGFAYQMFSSSCSGEACPWAHVKIANPEVAIPVTDLPAWMTRVREILAARPTCFPINGIVIRFSAASKSWLSMAQGREVAYVEFHVVRHPDEGEHEHFADAYDEIHQMSLLEFDARPHWGKNFAASFAFIDVAARYPRWNDFLALKDRLDPDGAFDNPYFERIRDRVAVPLQAGCAVDRACFCTDDSHCGSGRLCVPGSLIEEARVCR